MMKIPDSALVVAALVVLAVTPPLAVAQPGTPERVHPSADAVVATIPAGAQHIQWLFSVAAEERSEAPSASRPMAEGMTIGDLLAHDADTNNGFCTAALGEEGPVREIERTAHGDVTIRRVLDASFQYCPCTFADMTNPASPSAMRLHNGYPLPPPGLLDFRNNHALLQWSNSVTCMRHGGRVPLSTAEPREPTRDHPVPESSVSASEGHGDFFIGSSLFMVANLLPDEEPPAFVQVNVGYRLTPRDVVSVEAITWQYHSPLGVPWGSAKGSAQERYPGVVREYGVGLVYQRFLWNGLYSAAHALPLLQHYQDEDGRKIQNGFQLFVTGRLGYQVPFFGGRAFLEPSIAATAWPINTNVPESFAAKERNWPRYFLFEPGLHFGWRL